MANCSVDEVEKFDRLVAGGIDDKLAVQIKETVSRIEDIQVKELMDLLNHAVLRRGSFLRLNVSVQRGSSLSEGVLRRVNLLQNYPVGNFFLELFLMFV
jgi:hypothetical protein